jgi:acyl dehydratase
MLGVQREEALMAGKLRFADLALGQTYRSGARIVTEAEIIAFAREFDPQPFHLDHAAAAAGPFGGLAASGWHTVAMTMRLLVDGGLALEGGIVGAAIDELRWLRPVRPGDVLSVESEVLELIPSKSRPAGGRVRVAARTLAADGTVVQSWIGTLVMRD